MTTTSQNGGGLAFHNPDGYWRNTESAYPHYPTIRHRKRFILHTLSKHGCSAHSTVFDFGCGEGSLLRTFQDSFCLPADHIGGCDISEYAIAQARKKTCSPHLYAESSPCIQEKYDFVVCSEVIEHTKKYEDILRWIYAHLRKNGMLILTTQSGKSMLPTDTPAILSTSSFGILDPHCHRLAFPYTSPENGDFPCSQCKSTAQTFALMKFENNTWKVHFHSKSVLYFPWLTMDTFCTMQSPSVRKYTSAQSERMFRNLMVVPAGRGHNRIARQLKH